MTENKTPESTAASVTVDAQAFIQAVLNLAPFAGTDDTLPVLTCVRLVLQDGRLRMEATDRYVAGWDSLEIAGDPDGTLDVNADAKDLLRVAKAHKATLGRPAQWANMDPQPRVVISHSDGAYFALVTLTGYLGPDVSASAQVRTGSFPQIARLVPVTDGTLVTRFNAKNLATLARISFGGKPDGTIVRLNLQEGSKPALIGVDGHDTFGALAMPVREKDEKSATRWTPAGRWPEAGDVIRFGKSNPAIHNGDYLVDSADMTVTRFSKDGEEYAIPTGLYRELQPQVVKSRTEARPVPEPVPQADSEPDTRPASAKYRALKGYPPVMPEVKEPTVDQLEAMLRDAALDTGRPSFETSCAKAARSSRTASAPTATRPGCAGTR